MRSTLAATLATTALLTTGCGFLERDLPAEVPNTQQERGSTLSVSDWGAADGLLSVRIANDSNQVLQRADATITVTLSDGSALSARGSVPDDLCCTPLDVPPGTDFGLYVDLGERADEVEEVEVEYAKVSWAPERPGVELDLSEPTLVEDDGSAEVRMEITSSEDVTALAAQAFLNGPDGEFLAVVSGRFSCFTGEEPRKVVVELFHPVPAGTTIESVEAYPLSSAPAGAGAGCSE